MKKTILSLLVVVVALCLSCASSVKNTVVQTSTVDALLAGVYDGHISCRQLLEYGDFGLGTFDHLDGEMIVLNRKVYQVKADGNVYTPSETITTPFAAVCGFSSDYTLPLANGTDYETLKKCVNNAVPNQNVFCAIKIKGTFRKMKTRSVPRQQKPYPPLVEVTKNQPAFYMENISGTIVGFRSPPFVKGINVPGYHLHFISDDHSKGGHILSFELISGVSDLDICDRFLLILPGKGLEHLDLSKNRSKELKRVEQ